MKVIDGSFGKKEEDDKESKTLMEVIVEGMTKADVGQETKGQVFMLVNTEERFTFVTNEDSLSELACLLEVAKGTVLQQYADNL